MPEFTLICSWLGSRDQIYNPDSEILAYNFVKSYYYQKVKDSQGYELCECRKQWWRRDRKQMGS